MRGKNLLLVGIWTLMLWGCAAPSDPFPDDRDTEFEVRRDQPADQDETSEEPATPELDTTEPIYDPEVDDPVQPDPDTDEPVVEDPVAPPPVGGEPSEPTQDDPPRDPDQTDPSQTDPPDAPMQDGNMSPVQKPPVYDPEPEPNRPVVVKTAPALVSALQSAKPGAVVYVNDSARLDLSPYPEITIPAYVTLKSGGGYGGAGGALVYSTRADAKLFRAGGHGVRITGLRIMGPNTTTGVVNGVKPPYGDAVSRALTVSGADNVQVDHCELMGWTHAAISYSAAQRGYVHHNSIHHNRYYWLGYGIVGVRDTTFIVERNSFDYNRHSIAATGRRGISYVARHNWVGPWRNGHAFDMHGEGEAEKNDSKYAGDFIHVHDNTFIKSEYRDVVIRGIPSVGAFFSGNCFGQTESAKRSIVQERYFGNMNIGENHFGVANGVCHYRTGGGRAVRSDINGDGYADVLTLHEQSAQVLAGSQTGDLREMPPTFRHTMNSALFDGTGHTIVDVADVDGDQRSDLITIHGNGNAYVYGGTHESGFSSGVASFGGTYIDTYTPIAVADVNGDGRGDLVSHRGGSIYVHPGTTSRKFTASTASFKGTFDMAEDERDWGHHPVDVADVNGDGRADLVTIHSNGNGYVYPGRADGSFGGAVASFNKTAKLSFTSGVGFEPIGLGDVDGDGLSDLVMAYSNGSVYVYPGTTSGKFGSRIENFNGTMKSSLFGEAGHEIIAPLDVTGDGRADLVTAHSSGDIIVYPGKADGSFGYTKKTPRNHESTRVSPYGHEAMSEKPRFRRRGL